MMLLEKDLDQKVGMRNVNLEMTEINQARRCVDRAGLLELCGPDFLFIKLALTSCLPATYVHIEPPSWRKAECARGSLGLHVLLLLQDFFLFPKKVFW